MLQLKVKVMFHFTYMRLKCNNKNRIFLRESPCMSSYGRHQPSYMVHIVTCSK